MELPRLPLRVSFSGRCTSSALYYSIYADNCVVGCCNSDDVITSPSSASSSKVDYEYDAVDQCVCQGNERHLAMASGEKRNCVIDSSFTHFVLFFLVVNSRALIGCADPPSKGFGAPHECPSRFGSTLYLIYAEFHTFQCLVIMTQVCGNKQRLARSGVADEYYNKWKNRS